MAPASASPPIVPAPTTESRAAGLLDQRWDGMRIGYCCDPFDRVQGPFNQYPSAHDPVEGLQNKYLSRRAPRWYL
jgi:hypothetical protein